MSETLEQRIALQLKFYFSDINLSRDPFLINKINADSEKWVEIETLLTFARLKSLDATKELIVSAVNTHSQDMLEISDCETKLRRRLDKPIPEFDEEFRKSLYERTVHVYGFATDTTEDDLRAFCAPFGTIQALKMNKKKAKRVCINKKKKGKDAQEKCVDKVFKGCIHVTFATKDMADSMLANELTYNDKTLLKENAVQYYERRQQFIKQKRDMKAKKRTNVEVSAVELKSEAAEHESIINGLEQVTIDQTLDDDEHIAAQQEN